MSKLIDLNGQKFGKWTVIRFIGNANYGWLCRCDCGREVIVKGGSLRNGNSKSCRSCHSKNINTTHGQTRTRLYYVWQNMINRCENAKTRAYKNYGGRGIMVCSEWHDAATFFKWALSHGYKEGLTIDRIDNNGNYEPDNCQFITKSENSRKPKHIDYSLEIVFT